MNFCASRPEPGSYCEFGDRRATWAEDEFLRAFYCTRETEENGQYLMNFVKHDSIIYTNLGMGGKIDEQLISAGHGNMLEPGQIIETCFGRGSDELVNRVFRAIAGTLLGIGLFVFRAIAGTLLGIGLFVFKDFVSQKLPFKRFNMNAACYYLSLAAFLLLKHLSTMPAMASFRYQLTPPVYAGNYLTLQENKQEIPIYDPESYGLNNE